MRHAPLLVLCATLLHAVRAEGADEAADVPLLSGADFLTTVGEGDRVWLVTFGIQGTGDAISRSARVASRLDWVHARWMDVATDTEARILADLHDIAQYPTTVAFSSGAAVKLAGPSDISVKNAIESWLPDRAAAATSPQTLRLLLPAAATLPSSAAEGTLCTLGASSDDAESVARLRATALRFAHSGVGFAYDAAPDAAKAVCRVAGSEVLREESAAGYADLVAALRPVVAEHGRAPAEAARLLQVQREHATANMHSKILPQINSVSAWEENTRASQGGFQTVFFLNSNSENFDDHFSTAVEVAKSGGGKLAAKIPFAFAWVDVSEEPAALLSVFEISVVKGKARGIPTASFVAPVQREGPDGKKEAARALSLGDRSINKNFDAASIINYIEKKLMSNTAQIRELKEDLLADSASYSEGEGGVAGAVSDEADALVFTGEDIGAVEGEAKEGGGGGAGKKDAAKKKQAEKEKAKKKAAEEAKKAKAKAKAGKKKPKTEKQLKKEAEEKERIEKELEEKRLAREKRLKEKKEAEEEAKRVKAEEAAAAKKLGKKKGKGAEKGKGKGKKEESSKKEKEKLKEKEKAEKKKKAEQKKAEEKKAKAKKASEEKKRKQEKAQEKKRKAAEAKQEAKAEKEAAQEDAKEEKQAAPEGGADKQEGAAEAEAEAKPEAGEAAEGQEGKKKEDIKFSEEDLKKMMKDQEKKRKADEKMYRDMMAKLERERRAQEKKDREEKRRQEKARRREAAKEQREREKQWAEEDGEMIFIDDEL